MKSVARAILVVCIAFAPAALAGQSAKPRLAVKTFDNPTTSANSTLGNAVTDIFFTELGRTGRFQLVERAAFEEIAREIDFGNTDWAKKGTFAQKGGAAGADFIVFGKITNFSFQEHEIQQQVQTSRGAVMQTMYQQDAAVRVDFRVVSTSTGVAVVTESGNATQSHVSAAAEMATYRRLVQTGIFSAEAQDSLFGRTTIEAIRNAVRKLSDLSAEISNYTAGEATGATIDALGAASGLITADVGGVFIVSLGLTQGLQKGDHLRVFAEQVTRNQRGEVVYREDQEIGVLEVIDVSMAAAAKTQLLPSASRPRAPMEGDIVRVDVEYAKALRAAAGPGGLAAGGAPDAAAEVQRLVLQGDRYTEDRYFAQAVDCYQRALALRPDTPDIMGKLVSAYLYNKQLAEAEDLISRLFAVSGSVSISVLHNHFIGSCAGDLIIRSDGIEYIPQKGDHGFRVPARDVTSVVEGRLGPVLPSLVLRFRDAKGDDKKYDFLMPAYLRTLDPNGIDLEHMFIGSDEALADTAKVDRIIIRLMSGR
jgi:curli biogenesis system outer membrane secretion channel CsgG